MFAICRAKSHTRLKLAFAVQLMSEEALYDINTQLLNHKAKLIHMYDTKGVGGVSIVAPQPEGPEFNSTIRPRTFCVEFACSPHVCVGSLRVLLLPPIVGIKLPMSVNSCFF